MTKRPPFIIVSNNAAFMARCVLTGRYVALAGKPRERRLIARDENLLKLMDKVQQRSPECFERLATGFQKRMRNATVQRIVAATEFPLPLPNLASEVQQ